MKIGDKVKILECHKIPDLVGREAKIVALADPEFAHYPVQVMLFEPMELQMETPFGIVEGKAKGPFSFREDELQLVAPDAGIPDEFKDAFNNNDKKE